MKTNKQTQISKKSKLESNLEVPEPTVTCPLDCVVVGDFGVGAGDVTEWVVGLEDDVAGLGGNGEVVEDEVVGLEDEVVGLEDEVVGPEDEVVGLVGVGERVGWGVGAT